MRLTNRDWQYILSAIVIIGAIWSNNGWWLLVLFLIWG